MKRTFIILSFMLATFSVASSQIKSDTVGIDSTQSVDSNPLVPSIDETVNYEEIEMYADQFIPRKASLYSAIIPGLGQAYNKNYWKIPIIYGGFIALGYTVNFYDGQYKDLRKDLFQLLQQQENGVGGNSPLGFTETQVRDRIDDAKRERDFYMIMTGVLYLLQIAEAHIDAHLKEFKLNPELKVSIEPMIENHRYNNYNAGLSLKLKF